MGLVDNINFFFTLVLDTLRQFGRGRIWLLLGGYFLLLFFALYAHYQFLAPVFYPFITGWVRLVAAIFSLNADAFFHYPGHFFLLGLYYGWAKLIIGLVVEGLVLGALALIFSSLFNDSEQEDTGAVIRRAAKLWLQLTLAWLVLNGLTTIVGQVVPTLMQNMLYSPKRQFVFAAVLMPGLLTIIIAPFFFALPAVAVRRVGALTAIGQSFRMFFRRPIMTLILTVIVISGPMLVSIINSFADRVVTTFRPELMFWVILGGLALEMFANFLWIGVATRYLTALDSE